MAAKKTSAKSMDRREVVAALVKDRGDALVVTGLGSSTYDTFAVGDHDLNFYLWGSMGGAAMVGFGLALAQPRRRVLVITGDGEMLMGIGSLATIAVAAPKNLAIAVIDNGHYGETGMQRAHTGLGVDITGMAKAAGIKSSTTLRSMNALKAWLKTWQSKSGPVFADIKVAAVQAPMRLPMRDGTAIKHRFRQALLGSAAFD
jgi:phosphonopyruvate decarboxylase